MGHLHPPPWAPIGHLQVLFSSLQLTLILIPDHIQTEALVDPCRGRKGFERPSLARGLQGPVRGAGNTGRTGMREEGTTGW